MLKKLFLLIVLCFCSFTTSAFADTSQMYRDDVLVPLKHKVLVCDDVSVPLREVCENLGYTVSWNDDLHLIRLHKNFDDVLIDIENNEIFVSNNKVEPKISPVVTSIVQGRAYISSNVLNSILRDSIKWDTEKNLLVTKTSSHPSNYDYFHEVKTIEFANESNECQTVIQIPQITNVLQLQSIYKINKFFRDIGDNYLSNLNQSNNDTLKVMFDCGYNQNNIISFHLTESRNNTLVRHNCYTFNLLTGEQLELTDILNVAPNNEIYTFFTPTIINPALSFEWYINGENVVFYFTNGSNISECKLNIRANLNLFKTNLCKFHDLIEEVSVKQYANKYCAQKGYVGCELTLVDKTCFDTTEFYVFQINDDKYLLVSRNCNDFVISSIKNNLYTFDHKDHRSEISDIDMYDATTSNNNADHFFEITDYKKDSHGNALMELSQYDFTKVVSKTYAFNKKTDDLSALSTDLVCPICVRDDNGFLYTIPYITINSSDADTVNHEIEKLYNPNILDKIYYSSYVNDNILSLCIFTVDNDPFIYNFDISTGKLLSNVELLQYRNLSQEQFLDNLYNNMKFRFLLENRIIKEEADHYVDQYKEMLLSNCSIHLPMYVDENNKLMVYTKIIPTGTNPTFPNFRLSPLTVSINVDDLCDINNVDLPDHCKYEGNYKLVMPCEFLKLLQPDGIVDSATLSIGNNGFCNMNCAYNNNSFSSIMDLKDSYSKLEVLQRNVFSLPNEDVIRSFESFFDFDNALDVTIHDEHILISNGTYTLDFVKE